MVPLLSNSACCRRDPPLRSGCKSQIGNAKRARLLGPLVRFLTAQVAACRQARLAAVAPQLGVRSGRRIIGRAYLTDETVLTAQKSPLGVARGCWPMERWGASPRPAMNYFAEREFYDLPAELSAAGGSGKCLCGGPLSIGHAGAMTSARVIGTALATGWAAGTAAAGQVSGRPLEAAVEQIRSSF